MPRNPGKSHQVIPILVTAILIAAAAGNTARAQNRTTLRDAARQLGIDRIDKYVPAPVLNNLALPTADDWRRFWTSIESALQSGDLQELAWMRPEAQRALLVLDTVKGGAPYADWLRQRLDYFEVADQVTKQLPAPGPKPVRPKGTPAPSRAAIVPPPPPKPAPVPEAVAQKRTESVTSLALWKDKLKGRPAPRRAKQLVPFLKKIFHAEGMPPELVWQAEVESSFNPEARSPVGARGLYQFMPATAKSFGLDEGPPDERLNPEKSARAAARYLKVLYKRFNSWPLALAAYNAGEGRVGKLLKQHRATTFSSVARHLPSETQMYVPKVLATVYHREGVDPEKLPPPG